MVAKLIYILNEDKQNYPSCTLKFMIKWFKTHLNETNNQNSIKVPKVVESTNKKTWL